MDHANQNRPPVCAAQLPRARRITSVRGSVDASDAWKRIPKRNDVSADVAVACFLEPRVLAPGPRRKH